jgi:Tol biopolymer transport system component
MAVANVDGTDARALRPPEGLNDYAAQWSPDGTKLVYQERIGSDALDVGNLYVEDLSSGRKTQITHLALTKAEWWWIPATFSPDGRTVIFHLPRQPSANMQWDVWSVPVTGGEPTLVLQDGAFPVYFPDGQRIAFVSELSPDLTGRSISIADSDGTRRTLVTAHAGIWSVAVSPDGSTIAYEDAGSIYVVDVSTGDSSRVADGGTAEWLDNDTLIVVPNT